MTQEVFIKAFDQLPETEAESFGLRPWLYRVATNACFNQLRSRRKLDRGGDAGLEHAASGIDEFERAQTVALVEQSLGEMNERYRTALVLRDLQGLPPEEIAEVLDVSRPTADVLVHRARASFKAVFARLAGSDAAAPAALGLVLVPLGVPAALQAMPPLPAHLAPLHALPQPGIPAAAGPAGAGLLTKIGAALTTKAAIGAAATALVIGGVAAVKEVHRDDPAPAAAAVSTPRAGGASQPSSTYAGLRGGPWAHHGLPMAGHGHGAAGHHAESGAHRSGHHSGSGSHDSVTHSAGGAAMTTHDSSTGTSRTSGHATGTTTHDAGEMSGGHSGGD